jgi:ABC-type sugar transport system permease subunit
MTKGEALQKKREATPAAPRQAKARKAAKPPTKAQVFLRKILTMRRKEAIAGILFISPWLLGIILFFITNLVQTVVVSLNRLTVQTEGGFILTWVGIRNYVYTLTENASYNRALAESVLSTIINVPMVIFFSLFMALFLNRRFPLRGAVRAIFFLPVIMATAAITSTMDNLMSMMMGGVSSIPPDMQRAGTGFSANTIAYLLRDIGIPNQAIDYVVDAIANLFDTIRASGVQIIIFLAALQAIPGALYEVAEIEGATAYESFWKITIPMVSPLILTNVVYTIVDAYAQSDIVDIAYSTGFSGQMNFGVSAAMSVVSIVVTCIVLFVIAGGVSRYVYYQN